MFRVVDLLTGEAPDAVRIALTEAWARSLVYCDIEGFALCEDGELYLLDEGGACAPCPLGRFEMWLDLAEGQRIRLYPAF